MTRLTWLIPAVMACATTTIPTESSTRASTGTLALSERGPASNPIVDMYLRCWRSWNERWQALGDCYDDAIVSEEPGSGSPPWVGKQAVMGHVELFKHVFPDAHGDPQLVLADGDRVASIALLGGTHRGEMRQPGGTIAPTGKRLGIVIAHAEELAPSRKALREEIFLDHAALWGQLGLYPGRHRALREHGWGKEVVVARRDDAERANVEAYRRRLQHWNARDRAAFAASLADRMVWSDLALPDDLDKGGALQLASALWGGFSDLAVRASTVWGAGAYVVARGVYEGTNDGDIPSLGLPKTGKRISLPYLEIAKFEDGKLIATWVFYDGLGLAAQLAGRP